MESWDFGFHKVCEGLQNKEHPSWLREKMAQKLADEY
jgi:hypothetical protein